MMSDSGQARPRKTRRERFLSVAERRTKRVLKEVVMLGNCSNRNAYEYTAADVSKIFGAIEAELARIRERFEKPERRKGVDFSLTD
jgi:hypothetical protein